MPEPNLSEPRIVELPSQRTIAVRVQQPMAALDLRSLFDRYMPAISASLAANGLTPQGPSFARYHAYGPDIVDVEMGLPVAAPLPGIRPLQAVGSGQIGTSELPGGSAAMLIHSGSYRTLAKAYDVLHDWIGTQGRHEAPGPWEVYVVAPGAVLKTSDLRTHVYWPVK